MRARDIVGQSVCGGDNCKWPSCAEYRCTGKDALNYIGFIGARTDAIIAALRAAGYEIVPDHLTQQMFDAAVTASDAHDRVSSYSALYSAMISAAKEQT